MSWDGKYTYSWEYSMLSTHWSWENFTVLHESNHTVLHEKCVWMPFYWVNTLKKKKKICIPLLKFSCFICFISWARLPPVEEARVTTPMEEAWWLHWRTSEHLAVLYLQPIATSLFLGGKRLIRAVGARTVELADFPTLHLYRHSQKCWDAFCMYFLCKARPKVGRHLPILPSSSPLIFPNKELVPHKVTGAWGVSSRMEDQVCTQRSLPMCRSWEWLVQVGSELAAPRQRVACTNLPELQV